jgi:mono/diheme cytochrome c family protein
MLTIAPRRQGPYYPIIIILALLLASACSPFARDDEPQDPIALGEELYRERCEVCHGGETGGAITDVPPPHNARGHTWHHGDCENLRMVMEGNREFRQEMLQAQGVPPEDTLMPSFQDQLSEEEAMAILEFLKTWWTEEQRVHQSNVTEDLC